MKHHRLSALLCLASTLALGQACLGASHAQETKSSPASEQHATKAKSASTPWWQQAVIYEIYPRSFQDSNGDGIGDLKGVTQRLDYLKELGVDAVWLTPFFPSPNADFGYDVSDYTDISPDYGTMADWDELVREADKRGIRLLVDLVLNHSSSEHPWFKESRSSKDNPKRDWYVWRDGRPDGQAPTNWISIFGGSTWKKDETTGQYYYHIFLPEQPDLNWSSPGLRQAMYDVARFWLKRGASGFRLDATPYLAEDTSFPQDPNPADGPPRWLKPYNSGLPGTNAVLRELRQVVDSFPGQPVLLGESTTATIEELDAVYGKNNDEVHLPMNFLFGNLTKLSAAAFKKQADDAQTKLGGKTPVFFFSSHDRWRQWSTFGDGKNNDQIAKLTAALTLCQRGAILLYYGEEIGMANMSDELLRQFPVGPKRPRADDRDRNRTPMHWTGEPGAGFSTGEPWLPVQAEARDRNVERQKGDKHSIYSWYQRLLELRHREPAFRNGGYLPLETGNPNVYAFCRTSTDGKNAVVILSTSAAPEQIHLSGLPAHTTGLDQIILSSPAASVPKGLSFTVEPYGVIISRLSAR